jgi:hypothetical protein
MSRPAFILYSRRHGFAGSSDWLRSPCERCVVFHQLAAASRAAKNLAYHQRCAVEVVNCESPPRRFSLRHRQSMACLAHRRELDDTIRSMIAAGVLVTSAKNHRYGY